MLGRDAASAMAAASAKSFFWRLDKGLNIVGRDQPHIVTMGHGNPAPVMRGRAGLHRHNTWLLIRKKLRQSPARYRPVKYNDAIRPDAANLKTVLGKVDHQYVNLRHGCLPHLGSNETTLAHSMPSGWGIHRISSDCQNALIFGLSEWSERTQGC